MTTTADTDPPALDPIECIDNDELAARLKIARTTPPQWRASGTGPAYVKVNGRVRYRIADVEAWLAENTRKPTRHLHYWGAPKSSAAQRDCP